MVGMPLPLMLMPAKQALCMLAAEAKRGQAYRPHWQCMQLLGGEVTELGWARQKTAGQRAAAVCLLRTPRALLVLVELQAPDLPLTRGRQLGTRQQWRGKASCKRGLPPRP